MAGKTYSFGIGKVGFGKLVDGEVVEYSEPYTFQSTPLDKNFSATGAWIDDATPLIVARLSELTMAKGEIDEAAKSFFHLNAIPLFTVEFITKRVKLRRTILAYMGKPEHVKRLKSIVRLPRVTIELKKPTD